MRLRCSSPRAGQGAGRRLGLGAVPSQAEQLGLEPSYLLPSLVVPILLIGGVVVATQVVVVEWWSGVVEWWSGGGKARSR